MQLPERDAAKHIKQTRAIVKQLRKIGIGFALEHYGVDQETLSDSRYSQARLHQDRWRIDAYADDRYRYAKDAWKESCAPQRQRDIKTIAERVENANAMAVLFQLGLDYMQGHYVHEPEVVLEDTDTGKHITLDDLIAANAN